MKYKVCDIHAHIVPSVDDGARDLDMSMEILRLAYEQGTRNIICTSHSGCNMARYRKNLKTLQAQAKKENIEINLYPGCEIYCSYNTASEIINELNENEIPTINGTKYVLIEFDPFASADSIINYVKQIHEAGYNTILAHTERHLGLSMDYNSICLLKKIGCLFQVNAYSLCDEKNMAIKLFARQLLNNKDVNFIGSDVHRTDHRSYIVQNGIDYIYQRCNTEYANDICYRNAEKILNIK